MSGGSQPVATSPFVDSVDDVWALLSGERLI
ncbi:MAG: hypothetical protein JWR57_511 [Mycetocola sp.]|jgi:hypothetical protein|nr:hypothetical protein [Mycetocola sp.]